MAPGLVLSVFPGIDLLGRAFEEQGYCVVRGPDLLWGGDVRQFHPPAGVFEGVIGGPPCQKFSGLEKLCRSRGVEHENLIPEFERVIAEAQPLWWVMENVPASPLPLVPGYHVHWQNVNNRWFGEVQNRLRRISFGTPDGRHLLLDVAIFEAPEWAHTVTSAHAGERRVRAKGTIARYSMPEAARLQGLPEDFLSRAPFTRQGGLKAIANGVPLPMGRAIAQAVLRAMRPAAQELPV